jgi:hypothetical protein
MRQSQPELKVSQRTIPTQNLDHDGKEKTGDVNDPDGPMFGTPNGSKEGKYDPKKVNQDDEIS